jgi:hypothetical protein
VVDSAIREGALSERQNKQEDGSDSEEDPRGNGRITGGLTHARSHGELDRRSDPCGDHQKEVHDR